MKFLEQKIDRYEKIQHYLKKRDTSKNKKKRMYFEEYAKLYLHSGESLEELDTLYQETIEAYHLRKNVLDALYNEIKNIKKLRV